MEPRCCFGEHHRAFETVIGKLNALVGGTHARFGIPFTDMQTLMGGCDGLLRAGFQSMGRELLYSGVNGRPLDGLAFIGCVFYQRLRHMVVDKLHARSLVLPCHILYG